MLYMSAGVARAWALSDVQVISDPHRGRYMGLLAFNFFFFSLPRFCPRHISGTVTRRDSRLSVLLGPAV